jgi:RHS repeat-associated protein
MPPSAPTATCPARPPCSFSNRTTRIIGTARTDRLGIPHTLAASNGTVVWSGAYDAFGNCVVGVETVVSHLRLPGQYYDAETGLSYNLNRYYDSKTGRYLQPDPAGDGLNPTLCGRQSGQRIDPDGLCALRMVGGGIMTKVGYGLASTGVGSLIGVPMMFYGADMAVAGFRSLWAGEYKMAGVDGRTTGSSRIPLLPLSRMERPDSF